jgi:hypothetical protein
VPATEGAGLSHCKVRFRKNGGGFLLKPKLRDFRRRLGLFGTFAIFFDFFFDLKGNYIYPQQAADVGI